MWNFVSTVRSFAGGSQIARTALEEKEGEI
jgi:hypothetical protein